MDDVFGQETLEIMSTAKWYNQWLFDVIKKDLSGKILEVGAGIGNFTTLLESRGVVYAVDINNSYIKNLKKTLPKSIHVGYGDIEKGKIDFRNEKFNSIVCMNVLEHIKDDKIALKNMFRILAPNGKLILLVPAFKFAFGKLDENLGHERRYAMNELEDKLLTAGFSIKSQRYLNMLGIFGWFVNSRLLKKNLIPRSQLKIFNLVARPFVTFENYFNPPFGLSVLFVAQKTK